MTTHVRTLLGALALLGALLIGFLASQPPRPEPDAAAASTFSAGRAMADVAQIARAPRPTGSPENARVRAYLAARMRQLGMSVEMQSGPLPAKSRQRLRDWGDPEAASATAVNVIGRLAGRDRSKPALLLMAHYDSVWASPGAADDAAGVAAALEIVRALKARGRPERDIVVLLTDAEELGLNGARLFFEGHPLARRIGAVINMEARGSGGRAAMFETGRANGRMIELYRASVARPFSNSLAVLIYELMPNNSDFTIPKELGLPGFNFAFIGKGGLYHSPMATVQTLDRGALQDMGAQALQVAAPLAFAASLPPPAPDAAFGDVLGLFVIAYQPPIGWAVLGLAAASLAFAWSRARKRAALTGGELLGGIALALALLLHSALLLRVGNLLSGSGGQTNYYDRLAALPRLEVQASLLCVAALLIACSRPSVRRRLMQAAPASLLTVLALLLGGWSVVTLALGAASVLAALAVPTRGTSLWGGWFGFTGIALVLALALQFLTPLAAPLVAWPLALAAVAALLAASDPVLDRPATLFVLALIAAIGGGQLLYLAHFTFLGVGAGMPEVLALHAWLAAMLLWPLLQRPARPRLYQLAAMLLMLGSAGLALSVRFDPVAETIPPYSERR